MTEQYIYPFPGYVAHAQHDAALRQYCLRLRRIDSDELLMSKWVYFGGDLEENSRGLVRDYEDHLLRKAQDRLRETDNAIDDLTYRLDHLKNTKLPLQKQFLRDVLALRKARKEYETR